MHKSMSVTIMVLSIFGISAAQNWQQLAVPTAQNVNDIYVGDTQNVWAAADQGVLKSTDGGESWNLYITGDDLNGIHFIDLSNGWACGNDGFLIHTTNGGATWMNQNSGAFDKLRDVFMVDGSIGWIAGRAGILRKTTDAGMTWTQQPNPAPDDLHKIFAIDANNAWIVGQDGFILHTSNGGANWIAQPSGFNETFESVYFTDSQNGWVCGNLGMLKNTTDAGASWITQATETTATINDITFTDLNNGWIVTQNGEIYHTVDGGTSWSLSEDFFSGLFAVSFINPNYGFVSGMNGFAARYNAVTGIEDDNVLIPSDLAVSQNYPNPFNASTAINYTLSRSAKVDIEIFDLQGRSVEHISSGEQTPGSYQINWNGNKYTSGTYFYRIAAGDRSETRKMTLLK